jgi:hypothetical protein
MRTTGVGVRLQVPEPAINRFAVGARRGPAPPGMMGSLVTDTAEQPHADANGESLTSSAATTAPASTAVIVR